MLKRKKVLILTSDGNLRDVLNFCLDGWGYEIFHEDFPILDIPSDISFIKRIAPDVIVLDVHSASKAQLAICHLLKKDFTTAFIPIITLINKRHLREQLLNIKEGVDDYLIKPPDPLDLHVRIEMAFRRSQFSFNANSLTGLPGGRTLEEVLKERVEKKVSFSFAYVDIDNFKYYNDVYGYHKGDCVIIQCAHLLYNTIRAIGNDKDIICHIGGDDFAFITTHSKYKDICHSFISAFEKIVPFHYIPEDRSQRFIMARDRTHQIKKIPLMSVSIAVVNKYSNDGIHNNIQLNERVTEIKKYLKAIAGSKFMVDRRDNKSAVQNPQLYDSKEKGIDSYIPLGQILLEKKVVLPEQLDEALKLHWKRGSFLGEILMGLGFLNKQQLNEALNMQKAL